MGLRSGLVFVHTCTCRTKPFESGKTWMICPMIHKPLGAVSSKMRTMGLILEHFLKFLLKCFLRASEKQHKKKTSAKFMNAWKCVPTQQTFSELCSPGKVFLSWKRVFVLLNLHTYTPRQLLVRACNSSDVCSQNREWDSPCVFLRNRIWDNSGWFTTAISSSESLLKLRTNPRWENFHECQMFS